MELSKAKIGVYASLSAKKMRQKYSLFLAEGEKCVFDTLGAFPLECIVATEDWLKGKNVIPDDCEGKIFSVNAASMRKISSLSTPPEIAAVFHIPKPDNAVKISSDKLYLLLDGIQDPGNLGTIIRTADWFGVDTILASHDTVDIYNPKVIQATMGSLKRIKLIYCDLLKIVESHRDMPVYGLMLDGKNIYSCQHLSHHGFIVMGNEGNGISMSLRTMVDYPLLIPPYDEGSHPESLNVAVATAITLSRFRGDELMHKSDHSK